MSGLYLHIPFCKQACHYCDFHFSTNLSRQDVIIDAMIKELTLQKDYLKNHELNSIYFGGGTPSLLEYKHFEKIFKAIHKLFTLGHSCEITLEANPDDLSPEKLNTFIMAGVNRLSIGVQSFDDSVLKFLNRAHDKKMALAALENARKAGFENISIDLIYAIPDQNQIVLEKNIDTALMFAPEHFSAYSLTIENKTVFGNQAAKKKFVSTDEAENASQFELLVEKLTKAGYNHYEISNFCQPGFYSRHNSNYWKQEPYLGVGPSAHSYDKLSRQFNIKNNSLYLNSINEGKIPFEREVLTRENKINEYIFTTLRTSWGCDLDKLKLDYSFDLLHTYRDYMEKLTKNKLATTDKGILQLTSKGMLLADQIAMDLMV